MHVKLKVLRGGSAGKEIVVRVPKFLIGRAEECNLRVNSDAISRQHCAITIDEQEARIRDLGSRNGTFVNGVRIEGPQRIQMGDQLRVGPLEFLVTFVKSSEAASKVPAVNSSPVSADDMAGLISDWLNEADDNDRRTKQADSETRALKLEETDRIQVSSTVEPDVEAPATKTPKEAAEAIAETKAEAAFAKKAQAKNTAPKDTQEAAAQTLRKFFNKGS